MVRLVISLGVIIAAGTVLLGCTPFVEKPKYKVARRDGRIQIRRYPAAIAAEVEVAGDRKRGVNSGFGPLADYIFGNNEGGAKIAMTAPVTQEGKGDKIAMTAPVMQAPGEGGAWRVRFIMPSKYTMATLPKPKNPAVTLHEVPAKSVAAIRFTCLASDRRVAKFTARLEEFVKAEKLEPAGPPSFAYYDPPWTLPFLRRNEVMIEVKE